METFATTSLTLLPNLRSTRMKKYSKSAKRINPMLIRIQAMRGQILFEGGIVVVALLFRLIVIRSRVRRRPSLKKKNQTLEISEIPHLPGTASTLTAKLTQLTTTIKKQGMK